ncbi:MAG TPA: M20/M25/M40 family metallo-hydrolase [Croceibacterium sp.]|nr:M20/M25/M40 family metallo-hydrolase [Croceibacterium sp.]
MRKLLLAGAAALAAVPFHAAFADASDAEINRIVDEGLSHSEAMLTGSELMDEIGPRLTNSDNMERAQDWAEAKFRDYGLTGIHREGYDFGVGWNLDGYSAKVVQPRAIEMTAIPVAWSPPTGGTITAPVILAPMSKKEHFEKWRGKLAGKIVLVSLPGTASQSEKPVFDRYDDKELGELDKYELPSDDTKPYEEFVKGDKFPLELSRFLKAEGAVAMVRKGYRDMGLVSGDGYLIQPGNTLALPFMELAAEDYRRLARLETIGKPPTISLTIDARFDESDLTAHNLIADIAGRDPKAGYVMAGAHFDSWIGADGATDNGAGSVVVLEAARILAKTPRPKRTIRFALWSGEEQAIMGSTAYIEQHLAHRPVDPKLGPLDYFAEWPGTFPIEKKPGYDELKAYFNLDNGAGKIRGIYAENNVGAIPTLQKWLAPFATMGAGTVVASRTGGTDHEYMQTIGLPGFQFIQDPLDYGRLTHHSNVDTLDHVPPDDIRQAATIMAAMLWQAANAEAVLPRPPLPTEPAKSDPFKIKDPDKE